MDLREDAEALAMALELGFAAVEDAVSCADTRITALERPPGALIDVALAGRKPALEVAHLLRTIPGEIDPGRVSRRVIARFASDLEGGRATPERVVRALCSMQLEGRVPDPEAASEIGRLDDVFSLARDGICGTREEAVRDLREFLKRYVA